MNERLVTTFDGLRVRTDRPLFSNVTFHPRTSALGHFPSVEIRACVVGRDGRFITTVTLTSIRCSTDIEAINASRWARVDLWSGVVSVDDPVRQIIN